MNRRVEARTKRNQTLRRDLAQTIIELRDAHKDWMKAYQDLKWTRFELEQVRAERNKLRQEIESFVGEL